MQPYHFDDWNSDAQDKDEGSLRQDLESLLASWREIEKGMKTQQAPALLYKDMATTSSVR